MTSEQALREEIEHLKSERDAAIKRAQVAEDERDALAASLEKIFYNAVTIKPGTSEAEELQGIYDEAGTALSGVSDSLARLKEQWQAAILMEYHQYCKGAQAEWREPMSAHEWASELLERRRQAEAGQ